MRGLQGRAWRAFADGRRRLARAGSARGATAATADARRADQEAWTAQLAARHVDYRSSIVPTTEPVCVVCVSQRAHMLGAVVDNVARQSHRQLEFVLVTNSAAYDGIDVDSAIGALRARDVAVRVLRSPPEQSLGRCLNAAFDTTDARFVAKFDDDDVYGTHYVTDALRAHAYAGAGIVGKHTYYAYVEDVDRTVLRFPGNEFRYSATLAGGTLVVDRSRVGDLRFPDVSLGEDRAYIAACHRRGASTFAADRFNYIQTRAHDNTWAVDDAEFLSATTPVGPGLCVDTVNI